MSQGRLEEKPPVDPDGAGAPDVVEPEELHLNHSKVLTPLINDISVKVIPTPAPAQANSNLSPRTPTPQTPTVPSPGVSGAIVQPSNNKPADPEAKPPKAKKAHKRTKKRTVGGIDHETS